MKYETKKKAFRVIDVAYETVMLVPSFAFSIGNLIACRGDITKMIQNADQWTRDIMMPIIKLAEKWGIYTIIYQI